MPEVVEIHIELTKFQLPEAVHAGLLYSIAKIQDIRCHRTKHKKLKDSLI
jgi:hypothetical protein